MTYLSLYRRYRPAIFADVLGQAHVTETLAGAIREDRLSHAYLFAGPRGTGKTTTARILAKALNCEKGPSPAPCGECSRCKEIADGTSLDVLELDAASHTSVDDVREIRERIPYATAGGGRKVYIIDEAHQLSNPAFNALLKMLEEPPEHVVFVLATTESHKVPATVVSRCQRFEFRRLTGEVLGGHLLDIAKRESIEVDEEAIGLIVRHSRGSARDALSLLDQAAGTAQGAVTRQTILDILGEAPEDVLLDLAEAISTQDILGVFGKVEELTNLGWDPRQLLVQLLEEFRALFLAHRGVTADSDIDPMHAERRTALGTSFTNAHLEWVLQALADAQADMRLSTHPRLTLEVALARAANLEVRETQTVVARLERLERALLSGERPPAPPRPAPSAPPAAELAKAMAATAPEEPPSADKPVEPVHVAATPAAPELVAAAAEKASPAAKAVPVDGDIAAQWEAVLERVRSKSRVTHSHLREGWAIEIDGNELIVGFDKGFHAEAIGKRPEHTERIVGVIEEVFGRKLRIDPQFRPGERPGAGEPAVVPTEASAVDLARKTLGAEVVEERTSP